MITARKKFKFEAAHIVRDCPTRRCSESVHGHSYIVEMLIKSNGLDQAGMVMDFSHMKYVLDPIMDSFDHATILWSGDAADYLNAMKHYSARYVVLPVNATAENMSIWFAAFAWRALHNTDMENKLGNVTARVHETATGYAEADATVLNREAIKTMLAGTQFSDAVREDWPSINYYNDLLFSDEVLHLPESL